MRRACVAEWELKDVGASLLWPPRSDWTRQESRERMNGWKNIQRQQRQYRQHLNATWEVVNSPNIVGGKRKNLQRECKYSIREECGRSDSSLLSGAAKDRCYRRRRRRRRPQQEADVVTGGTILPQQQGPRTLYCIPSHVSRPNVTTHQPATFTTFIHKPI